MDLINIFMQTDDDEQDDNLESIIEFNRILLIALLALILSNTVIFLIFMFRFNKKTEGSKYDIFE